WRAAHELPEKRDLPFEVLPDRRQVFLVEAEALRERGVQTEPEAWMARGHAHGLGGVSGPAEHARAAHDAMLRGVDDALAGQLAHAEVVGVHDHVARGAR